MILDLKNFGKELRQGKNKKNLLKYRDKSIDWAQMYLTDSQVACLRLYTDDSLTVNIMLMTGLSTVSRSRILDFLDSIARGFKMIKNNGLIANAYSTDFLNTDYKETAKDNRYLYALGVKWLSLVAIEMQIMIQSAPKLEEDLYVFKGSRYYKGVPESEYSCEPSGGKCGVKFTQKLFNSATFSVEGIEEGFQDAKCCSNILLLKKGTPLFAVPPKYTKYPQEREIILPIGITFDFINSQKLKKWTYLIQVQYDAKRTVIGPYGNHDPKYISDMPWAEIYVWETNNTESDIVSRNKKFKTVPLIGKVEKRSTRMFSNFSLDKLIKQTGVTTEIVNISNEIYEQEKSCPNNDPKAMSNKYECDTKTGLWIVKQKTKPQPPVQKIEDIKGMLVQRGQRDEWNQTNKKPCSKILPAAKSGKHICNPETGKWVLKTGPTGKKILAGGVTPSTSSKQTCNPNTASAKSGKHICNPKTGKWVLKTGPTGKKILVGL